MTMVDRRRTSGIGWVLKWTLLCTAFAPLSLAFAPVYWQDYFHAGTCDVTTPIHHNGNGRCEIKKEAGAQFLMRIEDKSIEDLGVFRLERDKLEKLDDDTHSDRLRRRGLHYGRMQFRLAYTDCVMCEFDDLKRMTNDDAVSEVYCPSVSFRKLLFVGDDVWWRNFETHSPFVSLGEGLPKSETEGQFVDVSLAPELWRIGYEQGEVPTTGAFLDCLDNFRWISLRWDFVEAEKTVEIDDVQIYLGADPPVLNSVNPTPLYTTAGYPVTLHGAYFGLTGHTDLITGEVESSMWCWWNENIDTAAGVIEFSVASCEAPDLPVGIASLALCHTVVANPSYNDGRICSTTSLVVQVIDAPKITSLSPGAGDLGGGQVVDVYGENFSLESGKQSKLRCMFGDVEAAAVELVNDGQVRCTAPPHPAEAVRVKVSVNENHFVESPTKFYYQSAHPETIDPKSGVVDGGTVVSILGNGFVNPFDSSIKCRFGSTEVVAEFISDTCVTCITPNNDRIGPVDVAVTFDDGQEWVQLHEYVYSLAPLSIFPVTGPVEGQTLVTFGLPAGLFNNQDIGHIFCRFGEADTANSFQATAVTSTEVVCQSPQHHFGSTAVYASLHDGTQWLEATEKFYFFEVTLLEPSIGPWHGSTAVRIEFDGLLGLDRHTIFGGCSFGDQTVKGEMSVRPFVLVCVTPEHNKARPEVDLKVTVNGGGAFESSFSYYGLESVTPVRGHVGQIVTLHGRGFDLPVHYPAYCYFGVTKVEAERHDTYLKCPAPPPTAIQPETTVDVAVQFGDSDASSPSVDQVFTVFGATSLDPSHIPLGSESLVTVRGYGFALAEDFSSVKCVFVHGRRHPKSTEVPGIYRPAFHDVHGAQADGIVCRSPKDLTTDLTLLEVAPAGGAFTQDSLALTVYGATSASPLSGPAHGGTVVTVKGVGFTDQLVKCVFENFFATTGTYTSEEEIECTVPPRDQFQKSSVTLAVQLGRTTQPCDKVFTFHYK